MAELRLDLSKIDRDLGLHFDDSENLQDDGDVDELDPLMDDLSPDDRLSPLDKLQKYFQSDDVGERDVALRIIPETVQCIENFSDFDLLLDIVFTLATDYEPCIRINVLGSIASLINKNASLEDDGEEFALENEEKLFGVPIRMLLDINQQVRRGSQNCIVNLLEEEKGDKGVLLGQLCPALKRCLGKNENYDLRMDTALMLSRIASMLGREIIVKEFVPLLPSLALDTMFHVRKAFTMSCKDLCPVLGEDDTENHLLPLFFKLCKDEVWGVRKACADVFFEVSQSCNLGTRHDKLTPVYLGLLHDDSRWVRKAAFQNLGSFISSFHIPNGISSPELDDSFLPLTDSMLMDNSLLDNSALASCPTSEHTTDSDVDSRHPLPTETLSGISNSSTPDRPVAGKSKVAGNSNFDIHAYTAGSNSSKNNPSDSDFAKSGIQQTTSAEAMDKLTKSLKEMVVEDIESNSNGSLEKIVPQDSNMSSSITGHLNCEESEENDILDSAIEKIDVPGQRGEPVLGEIGKTLRQLIQPQFIEGQFDSDKENSSKVVTTSSKDTTGSLEMIEDSVDPESSYSNKSTPESAAVTPSPANTKPDGSACGESQESNLEQSNNNIKQFSEPQKLANSKTQVVGLDGTSTVGPAASKPLPCCLSKLLTDDGIRLRSSSEGSSFRSYFDEGVGNEAGCKKRRWSLDRNNSASQVRVFVQSASGQVVEQDLSVVDQEPDMPPYAHGEDLDLTGAPNTSVTASVAMDLTLDGTENIPSDTNLTKEMVGQEVVPDELMEIYLSMTEQVKAQVVDTDLPYYCAYSLPGVAQTLGREHWPLLKPTFDLLAGNMQWKIRRVLAFSLHELAKVIGRENMCTDILPVFEEYCTKDIDDVKIGAMWHLAEFFELLPDDLRKQNLPGILNGLQDMENEKNWRYRNVLAEQLILLCDLFECEFLEKFVYPTALSLAEDKVAEVRNTAAQVLGVILQKLSKTDVNKCQFILRQLKSYGSNERWMYRLMYVKQCEAFLVNGRISCELFASECLPVLLLLARDKVPNVRIAVAKMLKDSVFKIDYFQTENNEKFSVEELQITLECLQHDKDRDVKYFAGGEIMDTRRLVMLPVQWYAQRHRSESLQSQGSSDPDQYQDAREYFETENTLRQQPVSLKMAGVLADQPQNHVKPFPTIASLLSEPIKEERMEAGEIIESSTISEPLQTSTESLHDMIQDIIAVSQDTSQDAQDTSQDAQDTIRESQDIIESSLDTIGTVNNGSNASVDISHCIVDQVQCTAEEQVENTSTQDQDTTIQSQDTSTQDQDTIVQDQDTSTQDQDTTSQSQDTNTQDQDTIVQDQDSSIQDQDTTSQSQDTGTQDQDTTSQSRDTGTQDQDTTSQGHDTSTQDQDTITQGQDSTMQAWDAVIQHQDKSI